MAGRIRSRKDVRRPPSTMGDLIERLDRAASTLAETARSVSDRNGWNETWLDVLDTPPVAKTYGATVAHVITHSMHHRAQVLFMLRGLGLRDLPEGDVFSWERAEGAGNRRPFSADS